MVTWKSTIAWGLMRVRHSVHHNAQQCSCSQAILTYPLWVEERQREGLVSSTTGNTRETLSRATDTPTVGCNVTFIDWSNLCFSSTLWTVSSHTESKSFPSSSTLLINWQQNLCCITTKVGVSLFYQKQKVTPQKLIGLVCGESRFIVVFYRYTRATFNSAQVWL